MPAFVVGEYLFYFLTITAFIHARRKGGFYQYVWWSSFLAGTANDIFFMLLPVVDNFWHAQATLMITARLPFYIPCVYICFMYYPITAAKQLSLPPVSTAMLAGVLALLFYSPYDIVGARFLWWTWHETDLSVYNRLLGVPIGSSLWVMIFTASFYLVLYYSVQYVKQTGITKICFCVTSVCLLTTPFMLIQINLIQILTRQDVLSMIVLVASISLYCIMIALGFVYSNRSSLVWVKDASNTLIIYSLAVYFVTLCSINLLNAPENQLSMGVHQTFGPCHVKDKDITGHERKVFFCKEDIARNFTLDCNSVLPREYQNWYLICGKNTTDHAVLAGSLFLLCMLGIGVYSILYSRTTRLQ